MCCHSGLPVRSHTYKKPAREKDDSYVCIDSSKDKSEKWSCTHSHSNRDLVTYRISLKRGLVHDRFSDFSYERTLYRSWFHLISVVLSRLVISGSVHVARLRADASLRFSGLLPILCIVFPSNFAIFRARSRQNQVSIIGSVRKEIHNDIGDVCGLLIGRNIFQMV